MSEFETKSKENEEKKSSNNHDEMVTESGDLNEIIETLRNSNLEIKDRRYHLQSYGNCFVGNEAVKEMISCGLASNPEDAVSIGNLLIANNVIKHVTGDHDFKNEFLFYRFLADEDHGRKGSLSWNHLLTQFMKNNTEESIQPSFERIKNPSHAPEEHILTDITHDVTPLDEHNVRLLNNVHPASWNDPTGDDTYNLVVIGAGAGGLVTSIISVGLGAKVAIIEDHLMGGDCLNVGCVPSKALISCANVAQQVRDASKWGVHVKGDVEVDFPFIMERMRGFRADISRHDSAERYSGLGVDVFIGRGTFTGTHTAEVNGKTLKFRKAVIATGGRAALPNIPGISDGPYLTNANIWNLEDLPQTLIVMGGGPIGLEMAQSFQRFGSRVILLEVGSKTLQREDVDAAEIVQNALMEDGVEFKFNVKFDRIEYDDAVEGEYFRKVRVYIQRKVVKDDDSKEEEWQLEVVEGDALLVAIGRRPNVRNMGLENIGVEYDVRRGIVVNDYLQTTQKHIFAVGDCCSRYQFTHVADFMARMVVKNALFWGRNKFSSLLIPWCTYTQPEVAHVGLYPSDMEKDNIPFDTYMRPFASTDRCILESKTEGFVKIHCKKGTDKILGATIVGENAGDMISEISVAISGKVGLGAIGSVIHPYPTRADAIRVAGDMYNKTRLTPLVKGLLRTIVKAQR